MLPFILVFSVKIMDDENDDELQKQPPEVSYEKTCSRTCNFIKK